MHTNMLRYGLHKTALRHSVLLYAPKECRPFYCDTQKSRQKKTLVASIGTTFGQPSADCGCEHQMHQSPNSKDSNPLPDPQLSILELGAHRFREPL